MGQIYASSRQFREILKRGMISPSTWTFYADIRTRDGIRRIEFDVLQDRASISDTELGRRIQKTMDLIKRSRIVPAGALRHGVYRGFGSLFRQKWYRHRGVVKYDVDRHYHRGTGSF